MALVAFTAFGGGRKRWWSRIVRDH